MAHDTLATYPDNFEATMAYRAVKQLERSGVMNPSERILIVFGGDFDIELFRALGYDDVVQSSIMYADAESADLRKLDASTLPYDDDSFDHVFAHAGLHHASRPHQAVCEMYRVASRSALFFEAQDSFVMRALGKLGFVASYEWNAIIDNDFERGGVDDKPIPNHVLRWTPREVEKLVRSLDPAHVPNIHYFREWGIYFERLERRLTSTPLGKLPRPLLKRAVDTIGRVANELAGGQGNLFGVCIEKHGSGLQRWMKLEGGEPTFDRAVGRHQIRAKRSK